MRKMSVNGKIVEFEDHPYCGPTILSRSGEPLKHQPMDFLRAATLWAQQGRQVKDGLCAWNHEQEPIIKTLSKTSAVVVGWKPARKGE